MKARRAFHSSGQSGMEEDRMGQGKDQGQCRVGVGTGTGHDHDKTHHHMNTTHHLTRHGNYSCTSTYRISESLPKDTRDIRGTSFRCFVVGCFYLRGRLQISLLILSKFRQINYLLLI